MNLQKFREWQKNGFACFVRRFAVSFSVAVSLCWGGFVLGGCENSAQAPLESPQGVKTITFSTWGSAEEMGVVRRLVSAFEAEHPTIRVRLMHIPDQYFQKLHILVAGGLAPDVMFTNSLYVPVYAAHGVFADLTPYLQQPDAPISNDKPPEAPLRADDFYPQALQSCQWQASSQATPLLAAIPRDISNLVVYYNQDLFQAAGVEEPEASWTWQDFLEKSKKLTVDADHDGHPEQFAIGFNRTPPLFWLPYVWSAGGDVFDQTMSHMTLTQPQALEAIGFYAAWRNQYHIAPTQMEAGQATMSQLFLQGKLAMMVSGRWSVPVFREQAPFKWDVAPLPRGKFGSKVGIDASGFAMSTTTPFPQESWQLISYLASHNASSAYAQSGLIVPARKDVAQSDLFLNPGQLPRRSTVFLQTLTQGVPTRTPPRWNEVSERLGVALDPVWDGLTTPEAALKAVQADVDAMLPGSNTEARH